MIKKCIAFVLTTLVSLNASAAYTRYDFTGLLDGYFVQRDDNQAISHFNFTMTNILTGYYDHEYYSGPPVSTLITHHFYPFGGDGAKRLTAATTYFGADGPTNFDIYDDFGGDQITSFSIKFTQLSKGGFAYTVNYDRWMYQTGGYIAGAGTFSGGVYESAMPTSLIADLDFFGGYHEGVQVIVPEFIGRPSEVPESASLGLLAIGALSAVVGGRRKRAFA